MYVVLWNSVYIFLFCGIEQSYILCSVESRDHNTIIISNFSICGMYFSCISSCASSQVFSASACKTIGAHLKTTGFAKCISYILADQQISYRLAKYVHASALVFFLASSSYGLLHQFFPFASSKNKIPIDQQSRMTVYLVYIERYIHGDAKYAKILRKIGEINQLVLVFCTVSLHILL